MASKLKISILSDSPDGWMKKHVQSLVSEVKEAEFRQIYSEQEIQLGDILFILSFYKIIPEKFLKLNRHNIVVHASKLPEGKGWSPATWQILEGKNIIPLTLFEASKKADDGDIYYQDQMVLEGSELINEWQNKMGEKIIEMVKRFISEFPDAVSKKQQGKESFYSKRIPADSEIDPNKSIAEQFNNFRVADNEKYPVFFRFKGKKYILKIFGD